MMSELVSVEDQPLRSWIRKYSVDAGVRVAFVPVRQIEKNRC